MGIKKGFGVGGLSQDTMVTDSDVVTECLCLSVLPLEGMCVSASVYTSGHVT